MARPQEKQCVKIAHHQHCGLAFGFPSKLSPQRVAFEKPHPLGATVHPQVVPAKWGIISPEEPVLTAKVGNLIFSERGFFIFSPTSEDGESPIPSPTSAYELRRHKLRHRVGAHARRSARTGAVFEGAGGGFGPRDRGRLLA